ncbi:hypothetical protein L7F22_043042 [Adiantum nelumboides]|nr:hypothetical protein [Adiantum nelumboides]
MERHMRLGIKIYLVYLAHPSHEHDLKHQYTLLELLGLDPLATANTFGNARCVGEKKIDDEECFVLKLSADPSTLSERNNGPSEVIRHALLGYFSQRTGWLVYLEDTHLTQMHVSDTETVYWETTFESTLRDYKAVDGVTMSHAGHSVVTLLRFGNADVASHTWTRIEETWSIEEVAFNVQGLSQEFFLPPADVCSAK